MNILLTGASGFLGSRLYNEMHLHHAVTTVGRTAIGVDHVNCDLTKEVPRLFNRQVDLAIHAAGKAHSVPRGPAERNLYEQVNGLGTTRLLQALEQLPRLPKALVYISSVLVYGQSRGWLIDEAMPSNAKDPYGASKASAETIVQEWGARTGVRTTILRLPLVVADEPNGNLARLTNAIRRGYYVRIGDGSARRSMVRADDVAAIVVRAAEVGGTFNLTDGCHPSVRDLEEALVRQLAGQRLFNVRIPSIPLSVARTLAVLGDGINSIIGHRFPVDSATCQKLTSPLTFCDASARHHLNWSPRPVLDLFR